MSCPHSLVADGPLEADALLALEKALRVDLGLDRLELREAVRAPDVLLHRDALLFLLGVREVAGAVSAAGDARRPPPAFARGKATAASAAAPQIATTSARPRRAFKLGVAAVAAFGDVLWPGRSESVSWPLMLVVYRPRLTSVRARSELLERLRSTRING